MKKTISAVLVLVLLLSGIAALAISAVDYQGPIPLYVNKSKVSVYKEPKKDSKVIATLKGAASVVPEMVSGNWTGILIEDTKRGGQRVGWVQTKYLSSTYPQSLCSHKWGKWKTEREATCTEVGYRWRRCSICGLRDEQQIKKTGHTWGKWKVRKEATCVKKGTRVRTCKVCGKEEKEEYLEDHTFGAWKMTKEPTCTEKGERVHTCKVCGLKKTQALDKLPHDYEYRVTTKATDHSAGVRTKVCKVCGHVGGTESFDPKGTLRRGDRGEDVAAIQQLLVEQNYLNAGGADGIFGGGTEKALIRYQEDRDLNPDGVAWPQTIEDLQHDYGPWEVVKAMTRTEPGVRVRVCRGCGYEQRETIESGTVFERGRRGEDVRALQQIIKEAGYDAGGYDGIYGRKLDAAMAAFAQANDLVVEEGRIRPADVDAVVNAWLETLPETSWKGEGGANDPVDLALTVTAVGEADESGLQTYSWSLTNLGSSKAMFNALLLSFGASPDFRSEDLVMVLDGYELKANAANSVSGSFTADSNWGEGNLNFAAMAVRESDGSKWLSNTATFENAAAPTVKSVAPVARQIDVSDLPDGTYPVSFDRGDLLAGASAIYMNAVHVYTLDVYAPEAIEALKVGDTIVVEGEDVPVLTLNETEYGLLVNEDQDARAFYLNLDEDLGGYAVRGLNDLATYTEQGVTTLVVDPSATFTDAWDIEADPVTVAAEGIVEAMQSSANEYFVPQNTTVRVKDGKVVQIDRVYVP